MKVVAIEIAEVIEKGIVKFLEENDEAASMRFTRFIDLGGKQIELFMYPDQMGASVWCVIGIKAVFKTEEGDCVVYSVKIPSNERKFEDVLVNPEREKLPAMMERILKFLKDDLLQKASEKSRALEGGGLALGADQKGDPDPESEEGSASEEANPLEEIAKAEGEEEPEAAESQEAEEEKE